MLLYISGGIFNPKGHFNIGVQNPATVYMTGGEIICGSNLKLGVGSTDNNPIGIINVDGGILRITGADKLLYGPSLDNIINISDGVFIIAGDQSAEIAPFIASGQIVSTKPDLGIEAIYDEVNDETVVSATRSLLYAMDPTPPSSAEAVDYAPLTLVWTKGTQTAKHDVYIGFNLALYLLILNI